MSFVHGRPHVIGESEKGGEYMCGWCRSNWYLFGIPGLVLLAMLTLEIKN
jgi:hypothetical protein